MKLTVNVFLNSFENAQRVLTLDIQGKGKSFESDGGDIRSTVENAGGNQIASISQSGPTMSVFFQGRDRNNINAAVNEIKVSLRRISGLTLVEI